MQHVNQPVGSTLDRAFETKAWPHSDDNRFAVAAIAVAGAAIAAEPPITVERLLSEGWEVAGFTGTLDKRSTVILFHHKDRPYLVQCSVLYDVTRTPRMNTNCYEVG